MEKSTETLSERLDKAREENDDLRFQVMIRTNERNSYVTRMKLSKILLSRRGDVPVGREEHRVGRHTGTRARVGETAAEAADGS